MNYKKFHKPGAVLPCCFCCGGESNMKIRENGVEGSSSEIETPPGTKETSSFGVPYDDFQLSRQLLQDPQIPHELCTLNQIRGSQHPSLECSLIKGIRVAGVLGAHLSQLPRKRWRYWACLWFCKNYTETKSYSLDLKP